MKKRLALAVVLTAVAASAIWVFAGSKGIDPTDPQQVALGRTIYADHCAACHGAELEGEPDWQIRLPTGELPAPPHDVTGHTWHHSDLVLFDIAKHGIAKFAPPDYRTKMPAFAEVLSDGEIRAVLAYIKSTWPDDIRQRQAGMN